MDLSIWLIAGAVWAVLFAILGAMIGGRNGAEGEGCLLGLLLGPWGLLWAHLMKGTRRNCIHCLSLIPGGAKVCGACGREVPTPEESSRALTRSHDECPLCRKRLSPSDVQCPQCDLPVGQKVSRADNG